MNRSAKNAFMNIQGAATRFQDSVINALKRYAEEKEKAAEEVKDYKNESERLSAMTASLKANARSAINRAEQSFTGTIKSELVSLRSELSDHLLTAPNAQLVSALSVYRDFGIVPGKAEISALVQMAGGNTLALRCINGLLDSTKAGYTVVFPSSESLESDLDAIEKLSFGHFNYSPVDLHSIAVEIYGGQPVIFTRPDGTTYETGEKIDSVRLISSRAFFENAIKALDSMTNRWTENVLPSIQQLNTDLYPNGDEGKEAFAADKRATANSARIEKDPVLPDSAKQNTRNYAEILDAYRR